MKLKGLIIILLAVLISCSSGTEVQKREAVKGILNLNGIPDPYHFIIPLNGEWEFYWNQMLKPEDFRSKQIPKPYYGKVPSYWTDYPQEEIKTEKYGFATYRIRVILPDKGERSLGIDLPVFDDSYSIYLNGHYMGGNGHPSETAEESIPGYNRNFLGGTIALDTVEIIINVANFHHRRGGFWLPMNFGTLKQTINNMSDSKASDLAVMVFLAGFSLFFFFFFFLAPREKIMGYFSITILALASRPLFTSHYLINEFIELNWSWIIRFEYIGMFIVLIGWSWFNATLYPSRLFKMITWALTSFFGLAILLTLVLPVKIFSYYMLVYYPSMIILIIHLIYSSIRGIIKGNRIDIVYFIAAVLLLFAGFHDIAIAQGRAVKIPFYILTYYVVIFISIQAGTLLYTWVRDYRDRIRLQEEMEFLNRNLEKIVEERTKELKIRSEEIEKQNNQIADQNRRLSDTIQLKNKIFSVIAHDLRSPVVNILYLLNLLKEKKYESDREAFTDYSITYAQNVVSLLENMLVWGHGQEDKIRYSPARHDISAIISKNLSIFKGLGDKKEIKINFVSHGKGIAYVDRELVDMIIRNILSNAVKYTPRGGNIKITLSDDTESAGFIYLRICDTGAGIPEEKRKTIFTGAEIESNPGTEGEMGTGLGMKLVHELVLLNKGEISITGNGDKGSCFVLKFPS